MNLHDDSARRRRPLLLRVAAVVQLAYRLTIQAMQVGLVIVGAAVLIGAMAKAAMRAFLFGWSLWT